MLKLINTDDNNNDHLYVHSFASMQTVLCMCIVLNKEHFVISICNKKLQASHPIEGKLSLSISSPLSEKVKLVPYVSTPQNSRVYVKCLVSLNTKGLLNNQPT